MQVETVIYITILDAVTTVALILRSLHWIILPKKSEIRVYGVKQFLEFEWAENRVWILNIMRNF